MELDGNARKSSAFSPAPAGPLGHSVTIPVGATLSRAVPRLSGEPLGDQADG